MEPWGSFRIVLAAVEGRAADVLGDPCGDRVRWELVRLFHADEATASSIVAAVPVQLLDGLDGRTAELVRERLQPLVAAGARLVTTDDPCGTLPRVNWPELPEVVRLAAAERCPSCGLALAPVDAR
jgi:hypothetical protein